MHRHTWFGGLALLCVLAWMGPLTAEAPADLRAGFADPPVDCRPHTRWWWMGNALTKEDISWQLEQMRAQGIGGFEQITMAPVYEKGNVPYLSEEFFELLRHAVTEAKRLGMTASLNFGGPGWIWGGDWIPEDERNRSLLSSSVVVQGPARFDDVLPTAATINPREPERSVPTIKPEDRLVAVVAGRLSGDTLDSNSLQVLTAEVRDGRLAWDVPEGAWRIMAFWNALTDGSDTVNHIDRQAMTHYVEHLGARYLEGLGDAFAHVESLFGDSFEVPVPWNGIYWCDAVPEEFRARKGYDLIRHLPALWWEVGEISPKVRYDVNDMLHRMGMEAFYGVFTQWCREHGVRSRVQPYGFVTDSLEGAGAVDIPEMEITAGEKDAVPWFDTRIGPKKYVASGAHLYGRNVVTVEAYTYLHWDPYRATLEELKIASDIFLRSGANRFYNHGFTGTPERDIAPTRGFYAAIHISPDNVWWEHYRHLSDYVARCCWLLRQGAFRADVAVYSPLANQWALDAFNARRWTRDFNWGDLGRNLLSNGYDFDLINDDVLQRRAVFDGQNLKLGETTYRVLLVPNIAALPLESLRQIEAYATQGGVVIALERVPEASCGLRDSQTGDREVREIVARLFEEPVGRDGTGERAVGRGATYWLKDVIDRSNVLDRKSSALDPFLKVLRGHVRPDMGIDFVGEDLRANEGLCFVHRGDERREIYFVANVQDRPIDWDLEFRVTGAAPWRWDPYTGRVEMLREYEEREEGTLLPLQLAPYASAFVVFEKGERRPHAVSSSLTWIEGVDGQGATGWTDRAGDHYARLEPGATLRGRLDGVPAPLRVTGPWRLLIEHAEFGRIEKELDELVSWTDWPEAKHFSGTGVYTTEFRVPEAYTAEDVALFLDLGAVGNVAEVQLNGEPVGTSWMRGLPLDIAGKVQPGDNRLEVRVTNTLINRVAGMKEFPPVPEELQPRLGQGLSERRSPAHRLKGFEPLPRSGLLGPVEIRAYRRVELTP